MTNSIALLFQSADGNVNVRTVLDNNGEPWFCATDIAIAVGYSKPRDAIAAWMPERKTIQQILDTGKGCPDVSTHDFKVVFGQQWAAYKFIDEGMVYDFLMDCSAPKGKQFRKWLTKDVLPSIRKTGSYSTANAVPEIRDMKTALHLALHYQSALESLEEQAGLRNWYTESQMRQSNLWYGRSKNHIELRAISKMLGHEVRTRPTITSADIHNPTNMYHVDTWYAFASSKGRPLQLPDMATAHQLEIQQTAYKIASNTVTALGVH